MQIRRRAVLGAAMLAARSPAPGAQAPPGTWPDRPIRFVIGGSAGGVSDILVRILENRLREKLGQPLVLDPRPGAGGMVGAEVVARSPRRMAIASTSTTSPRTASGPASTSGSPSTR